MSDSCRVKAPGQACGSCPWRTDKDARDIPNFDLHLAEELANTCPDENGMGPSFGASWFACHQSREGEEKKRETKWNSEISQVDLVERSPTSI